MTSSSGWGCQRCLSKSVGAKSRARRGETERKGKTNGQLSCRETAQKRASSQHAVVDSVRRRVDIGGRDIPAVVLSIGHNLGSDVEAAPELGENRLAYSTPVAP